MMWRDVYASAVKQIVHGYARRGIEPPTGHRLDYTVAVRLPVIGYTQPQIAAAIRDGAPVAEAARIRTAPGESPDTSRDWSAYAHAKAAEAFTAQGQAQVARYAEKSKTWQREEQQDVRQIQRGYEQAGIEIPAEYQRQPKQQKQQGLEM